MSGAPFRDLIPRRAASAVSVAPDPQPRQLVVLQLEWTEDGRKRQELFGPWAQGDPETEEGSVAHMAAACRFIGEWRRVTGLGLADGGATAILVNDPDEWVRQREAGQPT
jgi:hypothetical protein